MLRLTQTIAISAVFGLLAPGCYEGTDTGGADDAADGDDSGGDDSPAPLACDVPELGPTPLRRLTNVEYNNTVRDLLGVSTALLSPVYVQIGFANDASLLGVDPLVAEEYMNAAEAAAAAADLTAVVPCDPTTTGDTACGHAFVDEFLLRAFRRPLDDDDRTAFYGLFDQSLADEDFDTAVTLVIQAALQSPSFLYRAEYGVGTPDGANRVALSQYELASRLSYLFWGSMPDTELLTAAQDGALGTAAEVEAHARRLLDDPRARAAVAEFNVQWLQLAGLGNVTKDAAEYPGFDDALRDDLRTQTMAFLEDVVFEGPGDFRSLLLADYTFLNGPLAAYYGISGPIDTSFERVTLDPTQHLGLLSHPSILAIAAKPAESSPVLRGKFVREQMLCQDLPAPPPDVDTNPPDVDPNATTRERFDQHTSDPSCAGCHNLIDPIGFGFEHYDGVGRWRDQENGQPIDATGELLGTDDVDGAFDGVPQLAQSLADSTQVHECFATQWFRYAQGRADTGEDDCALDKLQEQFTAKGYDVRELLVAMTQIDTFYFRRGMEG